eukprot:5922604-Pleurochrysis_carterae.AAC.1
MYGGRVGIPADSSNSASTGQRHLLTPTCRRLSDVTAFGTVAQALRWSSAVRTGGRRCTPPPPRARCAASSRCCAAALTPAPLTTCARAPHSATQPRAHAHNTLAPPSVGCLEALVATEGEGGSDLLVVVLTYKGELLFVSTCCDCIGFYGIQPSQSCFSKPVARRGFGRSL